MTRVTQYIMPADKGDTASTPAEQFGRRVRDLMRAKGWSQTELANRATQRLPDGCKMDRQSISNYIKGRNMPNQDRLTAIAAALEVEPYDLVRSPYVEWRGSGVAPGGQIGNGARPPATGPVQAAIREGSTDLSLDVQGPQARLRINRMVPLDIAMQIMELLTAGAKH